ncbi:elongin A, like [Echeneis naucrates]|uniref:elongin A, like n=1 Tax=Echeneis naucrates TaxID=173247 RepID=UPI0011134EFC|nr:elongin-A-like [Echeneis naucrates]
MASSSEVAKKVMRFKLQLTDPAESATMREAPLVLKLAASSCSAYGCHPSSLKVVKILKKLKDLDITLDILAETGIGKTVNSLRRHEKAGEFAKSLVKGWKKLVPKACSSHTEAGDASGTVFVKDKLDEESCPNTGHSTPEDFNNNCLTSVTKCQDSSDEDVSRRRKAASEKKILQQQKGNKKANREKSHQENQSFFQNFPVLEKKIGGETMEHSLASKKKKSDRSGRKSEAGDLFHGNKNSENTLQRSQSGSREKLKSNSDSGGIGPEKESNDKSKPSNYFSEEDEELFSIEPSHKSSNNGIRDDRSSGKLRSSKAQKRKRKKTSKEREVGLKDKQESESEGHSKHKAKKAKTKHKNSDSDQGGPSKSFESYLNYDVNAFKRKEQHGVKKLPKKIKTAIREEATKDPGMKLFKSPVMSVKVSPPKKFQASIVDLMNIPLPAVLPELEKPSAFEYFDRKAERESDFCDASEESAVFTGQRLNTKMQVYSGAKTVFLPTMMSLYQQCIRILQNNINLLYETGGVPFEILEPVLERCTPEQLLRIEECNPIYVGATDHLWGKHCQRDFKDSSLQEYESWKEMYTRLSEERERKLQRLTKSIVSAHSNKPKGRQVKMAFIHTVAKPPRDVRIQQEIHGTAAQQPHQPKCRSCSNDGKCGGGGGPLGAGAGPSVPLRGGPVLNGTVQRRDREEEPPGTVT